MVVRIKDVPGYEGIYEAHSDGTIWTYREFNSSKITPFKRKLSTVIRHRNEKSDRYDEFTHLSKNGNSKGVLVHRIVAMTFIPNPIDLPQVNHIDGNSLNNNLSNLEWCTPKYNVRHAVKHGLNPLCKIGYVVNTEGKEKYKFHSMRELHLILGHSINNKLKLNPLRRNFYGFLIYFDKDDENVNYDYCEYEDVFERPKNILLTNKNNEVYKFTSLCSTSIFLGKTLSFLNNLLEKFPKKRMFGGYKLSLPTDNKNVDYDYLDYFKCRNPKVTVFSKEGSKKHYFNNLNEASLFICKSSSFLGSVLKRFPDKRMICGHRITLDSDEKDHNYDYDNYDLKGIKKCAVKIKINGNVMDFKSQKTASRYLGKVETFIKDQKRFRGNHFFFGDYEIFID